MRQFKKVIFLGNGKQSRDEADRLVKRLREGLTILGGLQQPAHPISQKEKQNCNAIEKTMEKELKDIVADITIALGGDL